MPCSEVHWLKAIIQKLERAAVVLLNPAVMSAIAEVNHQANSEPDDQPRPVNPPELVHHIAIEKDAQHWNKRNPRRAERTRLFRIRFAQHHDRYTNNDERENRPDVDHLSNNINR